MLLIRKSYLELSNSLLNMFSPTLRLAAPMHNLFSGTTTVLQCHQVNTDLAMLLLISNYDNFDTVFAQSPIRVLQLNSQMASLTIKLMNQFEPLVLISMRRGRIRIV